MTAAVTKLALDNLRLRARLRMRGNKIACLKMAIFSLRLALKAAWKIKRV